VVDCGDAPGVPGRLRPHRCRPRGALRLSGPGSAASALAAGEHGGEPGRRRHRGRAFRRPVRRGGPAGVRHAPGARRRDPGGCGHGAGRTLRAGAAGVRGGAVGLAAGRPPAITADRGGHPRARPGPGQRADRRHLPARPDDHHHHLVRHARPPGRRGRTERGGDRRGRGQRRYEGGGGRAGRARPPAGLLRGRPAPAGAARRRGPARRAVPYHQPAGDRPGGRPDRDRRPADAGRPHPAIPAHPRAGGRELPAVPLRAAEQVAGGGRGTGRVTPGCRRGRS
jgi:hypothetical protein